MKGTYAHPQRIREVRGRPRTIVTILSLLVTTLVAAPAAADHPVDPVNGPLVAAQTVGGNPTCGVLGDWDHEFKVDQTPVSGTTYSDPNSSFEVTIFTQNTAQGQTMSFVSNLPVEGVFVKGGPQGNLYDYTALGGTTSDANLHAPVQGGGGTYAGISHVSFCFPEPPELQGEIAIQKTATGEFERVHDWDITKSADNTAVVLNPGESATVEWSVVVGYLGATDSNHKVTGVIRVGNVGNLDAHIASLTDLGEPVTDCWLNGAPFAIPGTLAVGDQIECNYSVDVAATDDTNTATVTGTFTDGEAFSETATENYSFGAPNPNLHETVNVSDLSDLLGAQNLGSLTAPNGGTFTYQHTFTWDGDACGTATYPNTASVIGDGNTLIDSDDETVTVTIICPEFEGETAWAANGNTAGELRYTQRGNWATYVHYTGEKTTTLFAGQTTPVGTVHFSAVSGGNVTITVTLSGGWVFEPEITNLMVQDYSSAPTGNPSPGLFDHKKECTSSPCSITVPANTYYGVHANVGQWVAP